MAKKQVICMRRDLNMRRGKEVSQGAHASMKAILDQGSFFTTETLFSAALASALKYVCSKVLVIPMTEHTEEWLTTNFKKICVQVTDEQDLFNIVEQAKLLKIPYSLILDSGLTEFGGVPTYTCCAIGPADEELINQITGNHKLL